MCNANYNAHLDVSVWLLYNAIMRLLRHSGMAVLLACCVFAGCNRARGPKFFVYYGAHLPYQFLQRSEVAIVDPDAVHPAQTRPYSGQWVAYVSVGQAEEHRASWAKFRQAPFLLSADPNWPGAHNVDVRAAAWQSWITSERVPQVLADGFRGIFFDTIDSALELEEADPQKYAGTTQTIINMLRSIRERFPLTLLLINNALPLLNDVGDMIDGVVVEDVYTHYDFATRQSEPTPESVTHAKELLLDAFQERFHKPVLVLLYDTSAETPLVKSAIAACARKHYRWYVTTPDLQQLGVMQP